MNLITGKLKFQNIYTTLMSHKTYGLKLVSGY